MKPKITLRYGAAHNSLTVGDTVIDIANLTSSQKYVARRSVIEGLKAERYFSKGAMKRNRELRKDAA